MSLGIAFKGPEGIVLAADSRVTITAQKANKLKDGNIQITQMPVYYDNATKLMEINGQKFVGVVTYGVGALGQSSPRTTNSYLPEFEAELQGGVERLGVKDFSDRLSSFFQERWKETMPKKFDGDLTFLVAGYDEDEPYGKIFEINIPNSPSPKPWHNGDSSFGPVWGGQADLTGRLIHGYDPGLPKKIKEHLGLDNKQLKELNEKVLSGLNLSIPYQFLALQDCVDLAVAMIRVTITLQGWCIGIRGVGGEIDVATITRIDGFKAVKIKEVTAKRIAEGI